LKNKVAKRMSEMKSEIENKSENKIAEIRERRDECTWGGHYG
jgi:hypothetical protein